MRRTRMALVMPVALLIGAVGMTASAGATDPGADGVDHPGVVAGPGATVGDSGGPGRPDVDPPGGYEAIDYEAIDLAQLAADTGRDLAEVLEWYSGREEFSSLREYLRTEFPEIYVTGVWRAEESPRGLIILNADPPPEVLDRAKADAVDVAFEVRDLPASRDLAPTMYAAMEAVRAAPGVENAIGSSDAEHGTITIEYSGTELTEQARLGILSELGHEAPSGFVVNLVHADTVATSVPAYSGGKNHGSSCTGGGYGQEWLHVRHLDREALCVLVGVRRRDLHARRSCRPELGGCQMVVVTDRNRDELHPVEHQPVPADHKLGDAGRR